MMRRVFDMLIMVTIVNSHGEEDGNVHGSDRDMMKMMMMMMMMMMMRMVVVVVVEVVIMMGILQIEFIL